MRGFNVTLAGVVLAAISGLAAFAAVPRDTSTNTTSISTSDAFTSPGTFRDARGGCGSKGGPGYRKSNGKCAGWKG